MNKYFWLIFLVAYSVNLTLQFALNTYKLIKLKEENALLKDKVRVEKESRTFTIQLEASCDIENEIENYFKNAGTDINFI